ncbi:MAG TPA: S8 family serine peptidase [Anaerolineales bacterium]|nr:S8 family serine peptidase [Anaerolineales bacterium]
MYRKIFSIFSFVMILAVVFSVVSPASAQPSVKSKGNGKVEKSPSGVYIVQLAEDPAVVYEGNIPGYSATKPNKGEKLNPNSAKVKKYVGFLNSRHNQVLNAVSGGEKLYDYNISFNGFAAKLTLAQAAALQARPDVLKVWADEARQIHTDNSPDFLGLTAEGGLWAELGGQGSAGEGIIIGVLDTGIWPEHPSFSDQADLSDCEGKSCRKTAVYSPPPADWHGTCVSGEQFSQNDCNYKLIGARFYRHGAAAATVIPDDYLSPRDRDGHGTHTASTAGGNANVPASIFGVDRGLVSGIAPRARIAAYKVCWNDAGCFTSDIVASIDGAVADGVDVINYSIGGGTAVVTADSVAFLFAADAGVFVATSAGNDGPGAGTVSSPGTAPWITTVGASTQDRTFEGSVLLGNAAEYFGATVTGGTEMLPLVDSADAGSELCFPGELDPSVVSGKIVLCLRGVNARVDKSLAVYLAGGAGMILYNPNDAQALVTDNHWVPSVHINFTDGSAVKAYIASAGASATAQINGGEAVSQDAPWMADFSSRGPDVAALDIIKPDVTAPGVNILAGNTPNPWLGAPGELFQSISGTSMSSPHVAGVFALLKQAHPEWSAAMAKSALMTTGSQDVMKEDGTTPADPFDMGGGHITSNSAVDPGLVYDVGFLDYLAFLCEAGPEAFANPASTCALLESLGFSTDPSDLNLASIGIAELAGSQTVVRRVTNVGPAATYTVSVDAPPGIDVDVSPSSLTLAAGESADYEVTFTTDGAPFDEWTFGSLTWSDGSHSVRSPIAITPVPLAAPFAVAGTGESGSASFEVTFGYNGAYTAAAHGLVPAVITTDNVGQDPDQEFDADDGFSNGHTFNLSGVAHFRIAMPPDATEAGADIDIYVEDPNGDIVAQSTNPETDELIDITSPMDGTWTVWIHGWLAPGGASDYDMYTWTVSATPGGSLNIDSAPPSATLGATEPITVSWTGATAGQWYLGAVSHNGDPGFMGLTLVNVDNR